MYKEAKARYAALGIDAEKAIDTLGRIALSMHCWQGDDVKGFLHREGELTGGIQATGSHPGAARTPQELRADIDLALSLIPGRHKVNLHAIYADTPEKVDLDQLEPRHFAPWVDWAKERGLGLDFNPTCFSHPMARSGFTLSSPQASVRAFWIEHVKRARRIGAYFGKELGQTCVTNVWIPDGYKDVPADRHAPRARLVQALDEAFAEKFPEGIHLDAVECKLFGIGSEAYVTGSHEFYMGYALTRGIALTLDAGHFHPTEAISDKISSLLLFSQTDMLLHVSRPMRWDSDHVVALDDELYQIAHELVRHEQYKRVHIGLDFFDASINRVAAWVIGMRNMQKALLYALLAPDALLVKAEEEGDYTTRLAYMEEMKTMPWSAVWEEFCQRENRPSGLAWLAQVRTYEADTLLKRG